MADSIVRLKVESSEYDQKLKRAAEGLTRYADECRKVGGTMEVVEKDTLEYVRALGQMDTVSRTATGKLSEMKKTFTELSVVYNKMTAEEKQSPFGQALSQSLDQLKVRINDSKTELNEVNQSLVGGGGLKDALNGVASQFGMNIEQLTKFGGVLGATSVALKTAKDAFFASETNVDDWGRTIAASEGIYDSFLQTLNNGDFSGFLSRIGEVISKAHDAYNALDELNTRMTIINPERTRLQARSTELKAIIRRQGADSEAGVNAKNELRQIEGMLSQAFKTESQLNMNAFKAQVDKKLADAGIKLGKKDYDFLMRTFSSDASFMAMKRGAKGSQGSDYIAGGSYDEGSTYKYDTRNMNQKLLDLFTDEWRKENSALLNAAFSAKGAAASTMLSDARYLKEGGGGSGGGSGRGGSIKTDQTELQKNQQTINELTQEYVNISDNANEATRARQEEIRQEIQLLEQRNNLLKLYAEQAQGKLQGGDVQTTGLGSGSFWGSFKDMKIEGLSEDQMEKVRKGMASMNQTANDSKKSFQGAASAVSAMGNALGSIKDPGVQIMGMIGQAIASIALGFAQASAKEGKGGIWYWIAATAAGLATMVATISSIHSATGYAQGGIVQGNSYSGDNIYGGPDAMVNAGELVLTRAQQSTLAGALQGNGMQNMNIAGRIKGTDIILSIDRSLKLEGKQLLTWGR